MGGLLAAGDPDRHELRGNDGARHVEPAVRRGAAAAASPLPPLAEARAGRRTPSHGRRLHPRWQVGSLIAFCVAFWPVWGWLTIPGIFVLFLGALNLSHFVPL